MPNNITSAYSKMQPIFGCNSSFKFRYLVEQVSSDRCLPVRLIGGDKAGNVSQDATATLDDGECVSVTAVGERPH